MWSFTVYPLVKLWGYKALNGVEDGEDSGEADPEG